ncbi:YcbX family protein [Vibrio genomosp. F10]|uniref:YcbX family protein n=1 Tax=Vibrio genomosp. F10 TaxID=723171 RepID=UPI00030469ED|nr:YcbX family protein [Vibrio genomosp. F10]OEF07483.1 (2Fe-2S)-binding protein [Vibrio genomosp. F10 str. 9ZB36]
MSLAHLSQINVYPVKSVGGVTLSSAWVELQGLSFDRRFMLAMADGSMVTARKHPQMVKVKASLLPHGFVFTAEGKEPLKISYAEFKKQETPATVWKDNFTAYTTTDKANDWFSDIIGQHVELLYCGEQSNRVRKKIGHNVSFADGYPVLLISQASLDELNRRSSEVHSMTQFRTNLVVSGTEPFAEDCWKTIRIGEVVFDIVKPCERCILTTVDTKKGTFRTSKEPLKTLMTFRADEQGGVFFGQNLVARNEGVITASDRVEVLEYQERQDYADRAPAKREKVADELDLDDEFDLDDELFQEEVTKFKSLTLTVNGKSFVGNNQQTLLEQAEDAGLKIASKCRVGLCGACKVSVESGKVDHADVPVLKLSKGLDNIAFACSCVPQTHCEIIS